MKKLMTSLLFMSCLLSGFASAQATWHGSTIKRVYPLSNGSVVFVFHQSSAACTGKDGYYYLQVGRNGVNQEGLTNMYSAALTAAASGKSVAINFDAASSACYINRLYVNF